MNLLSKKSLSIVDPRQIVPSGGSKPGLLFMGIFSSGIYYSIARDLADINAFSLRQLDPISCKNSVATKLSHDRDSNAQAILFFF